MNVPYEEHARWALEFVDGRFKKDLQSIFQVFGALVFVDVILTLFVVCDTHTDFFFKHYAAMT